MDDMSSEKVRNLLAIDSWRIFRIMSEFVDGFETMTDIGPSVSIFGSARIQPGSLYYNLASDVAAKISKKGFAVITGGGPGIMEAANKGTQSAGGKSCGICIDLPTEDEPNPFINPKFRLRLRYFFVRKVMFVRYAQAYVFLPGGVGTLDEFFEAMTLIQTNKIKEFPIYLMGTSYWEGLLQWLRETVLTMGCISEEDFDRITVTDDPEEVANGIEKHYQKFHADRNF